MKCVNDGETQIYLADSKFEVESIINKLVNEAVEDFGINEKDQKETYSKLKKMAVAIFDKKMLDLYDFALKRRGARTKFLKNILEVRGRYEIFSTNSTLKSLFNS